MEATESQRFVCVRACQYRNRIFSAGEILLARGGEDVPVHFRPMKITEPTQKNREENRIDNVRSWLNLSWPSFSQFVSQNGKSWETATQEAKVKAVKKWEALCPNEAGFPYPLPEVEQEKA